MSEFTDHERCLLIQEIGRMEELSFGSALELLDRLFGIAILSPAGETREPVDTGHLGTLIRQVSLRQDLPDHERRVLIRKLAFVGMEPEEHPPGRTSAVDLSGSISAWIRRGTDALSGRPFTMKSSGSVFAWIRRGTNALSGRPFTVRPSGPGSAWGCRGMNALSGRSFTVDLSGSISAWIRRGTDAISGRVRSHDPVDPGLEPLREAERIIRNMGMSTGRKSTRSARPSDLFHEIEIQDERLGRSMLGDAAYERSRRRQSPPCRRKQTQNTMHGAGEYDSSRGESADETFRRWLWGDE